MSAEGDDATPGDPFGPLAEAATVLHEILLAYVTAGFTEPQALYLVGVMITADMHKPPGAK